MATFGGAGYNAAKYASFRPTYPQSLFKFIFEFHRNSSVNSHWGTVVDLGCGTGQATRECLPFTRIIGVEPSAKMLEEARKVPKPLELKGELEYVQSAAEKLPFLEDSSVDLIISAQAAHWFDWTLLWKEAARVLCPGGTLAAWGYSEFRLTDYPSATPLINEFSQGADPLSSIGPYWERPGRTIVDNHLLAIPAPKDVIADTFSDFQRVYFRGNHHEYLPQAQSKPVILERTVTWDGLLAYLNTFSALHTFHQQHPEDLKSPDGDIAARFLRKLQAHVSEMSGGREVENCEEIKIEWPVALLLAKRA